MKVIHIHISGLHIRRLVVGGWSFFLDVRPDR